jgi:CBS-domain-containing membrane protein
MPPLHSLLIRHETARAAREHAKSVVGMFAGLMLVGALAALTGWPMLLAPLAPTALLLFSQPESPAAQPVNIFASYFIAAALAAASEIWFPGGWWAASLAVAGVMGLMLALRVTHPPAAAVPLVTLTTPQPPLMLFGVMFVACLVLVLVAVVHHRLPPRSLYPRPPRE